MDKTEMTTREALLVAWAVNECIDKHGWEVMRRDWLGDDDREPDYVVRRKGEDNSRHWSNFSKCEDAYNYVLKMITDC